MTDQQTISVYDTQTDAYEDFIKRQSSDPVLLSFIARILPGGYILDLGCGPAISSKVMRNNGLRVDPVDASAGMVRMANQKFDIGARQACFEDIDGIDSYDGIWANFSLLHAPAEDFGNILVALHRALKPAGIFHLGMKTGTGSKRDKLGRYYTYYSEEQLCDYLHRAGFIVEKTINREGRGLAGDVEPWIVLTCSVAANTSPESQAQSG